MDPKDAAVFFLLLKRDDSPLVISVSHAIQLLGLSDNYHETLKLIEAKNKEWLDSDNVLMDKQHSCITEQAAVIEDQRRLLERCFNLQALLNRSAAKMTMEYTKLAKSHLSGSKHLHKLRRSHRGLDRAFVKLHDSWSEQRLQISRQKLELAEKDWKKRQVELTEDQERQFAELLGRAPRMRNGKINFRRFERDILKSTFRDGINSRRFSGDGKYAKLLYIQVRSHL